MAPSQAPPCVLVIFGASGDLTSRKLLPALAALARKKALPASFAVVGVARTPLNDEGFRKLALEAVAQGSQEWEQLVGRFRYVAGDYTHPDTFGALKQVLDETDRSHGTAGNRVYYLATIPSLFGEVAEALGTHGLNRPERQDGFVRLVVEKPYGRDLDSAVALDAAVHRWFAEDQIYRIDHYMGKETVQNVLALRFANAVFEPIWNRRYVDHVQVTVAESLGVEHRGGFYETAGALRDIVQNHVMQVISLTLMEPPATVDGQGIRDEKVKLLRAIEVLDPEDVARNVVRGQYQAGWVEGRKVPAYRQEEGVDPHSMTETYVAMRLRIDNWRWAGVPVYVRTGKRLAKRATEVTMAFQPVPHLPFAGQLSEGLRPDMLVLRVQPDEGIALLFGAKVPGPDFRLTTVSMDFSYSETFLEDSPDAYERLIHDALIGDPMLFIRADEVELAWRIVDPILEAWQAGRSPLEGYPAGSWGPEAANRLLGRDGRFWRDP
jgi:glucose-6-phosphate 1-dehydrogenase